MSRGTQGDRVLFLREGPIEVEYIQKGGSQNNYRSTWHLGTTYMIHAKPGAGEEGGVSGEETRGRRKGKRNGWWACSLFCLV